ncbi:MAG: phytanoyl-CoA dioxygenase family protein [Gammaproteobacteria bacterium]|nr:phytanoyl-CoA dioxygenase family protein [Gammaproteobacteria bacterium]MCH9743522.1 phytanoyl-CoA dioxygenase family protein [Gammaproteobacteria bacterium]
MVYQLSQQDVSFYKENGYLVVSNIINEQDIKQANQLVDAVLKHRPLSDVAELEPKNSSIARRIWSPTKKITFLNDIVRRAALLDILEQLIGPNIFYHYSKLNLKAPKIGSEVAWHQDFSYYPHTNTDLVSALIHLDKATVENSCLMVLPGAHKLGLLDHYVDGYFRGKVSENIINDTQIKPVALEAEPGDIILIHCLLPHYSSANCSDQYRKVFIPAYRATDAFPIYFGPHAAHNEPSIELLRGKRSQCARVTIQGNYKLPFAERPFNSLYQIQEGSHREEAAVAGYYSD